MARIGVDLDGVVYNFIYNFDRLLLSKGIKPSINDYNRGLNKEDLHNNLEEISKTDVFLSCPAYPYALSSLRTLSSNDEVYLISYRNWCSNGETDTLKRLEMDNISVRDVIFSKHKGFEAKRLKLDYFVEDSIINAGHIVNISNAFVYLVNRRYNQGETPSRVKRIKDLREVVNELK
jgi:hypothetical protein